MRMNKAVFMFAVLGLALITNIVMGQSGEERRPPRAKWNRVVIEARVEAIDMEKREATLRGPNGNLLSVVVDERVTRLKEIEVGDIVSAEYWEFIVAEFRNPTPEEEETPLLVLTEAGKAPEGMPPGAAVGAVVQAVVTIEIINRPDMEVTIKGPRGNYLSIAVADKALIERLHVGEVVIMTYGEAVVLSLKKVDP